MGVPCERRDVLPIGDVSAVDRRCGQGIFILGMKRDDMRSIGAGRRAGPAVAAAGEAMPPKSTFSYGDDSPRRTFTAAGERFEASRGGRRE